MEYAVQPEELSSTIFQMEEPVQIFANQVSAPFYLRCAALFVDYMLLLAPPIVVLVSGRSFGEIIGSSGISSFAWYVVLILWLINFLAFPLFSGQTFGKMLAGITMVKTDGSPVRLGNLIRRNVVGYLLTALTFGLGFLLAVVNKSGRSLHDFIGGTIVVQGRRKRV
ncbi:MAG: RDD family protein [Chloracidobacterium sp.]|nr:RDD family protein [Chloracidobacterium sp.]